MLFRFLCIAPNERTAMPREEWTLEKFKSIKEACINFQCTTPEELDQKLVDNFGISLNAFSHARGKFEGTRGYRDLLSENSGMDILDETISLEKKIVSLQNELRRVKLKYRRSLEYRSLLEYLSSRLDELIPSIKRTPPQRHIQRTEDDEAKTEETVVVMYSDLHVGKVVRSEETGGMFEYNFDVFRDRVATMVDKIISFTKDNMRSHRFKRLVVVGLGDMVDGRIHSEIKETSDLNVVDQAIAGGYVTGVMLTELSMEFEQVDFFGITGNHGRVEKEVFYSGRTMNWDTVHYTVARLLCKEVDNIRFDIPRTFYTKADIEGYRFIFMHGDSVKVSSYGGIPWYGIEKIASKLTSIESAINKETFDYLLMGHFHMPTFLSRSGSGEIIINGSMVGGDTYSLGSKMVGSDPIQIMFGVHRNFGISWRLPINLRHPKPGSGLERYPYDARSDHITF